ncbi:MAG: Cro/CI family transcriptional regulator [Burkholderiaceae bacterium]|jgi:DNA-binding transcriptional regulator YdaS (Cro superfamily)|nr:Cro/CI family transcriptional regulator [Burkholderiaceae bacterium]
MDKSVAIELLGGSTSAAAAAIGITSAAVSQWPDQLPPRLADRVQAALARQKLPELAALTAAPGTAPELAQQEAA